MKCPSVSSATSGVRPTSSPQFSVQGCIRFLSHGDKPPFALDFKDPSQYRGCSSRFGEYPRNVLGRKSTGCKVCSQATKSGKVSGEGHLLRDRVSGIDAIDGPDHDDGDPVGGLDHDDGDHIGGYGGFDELACFRGLVLDVSYRPINVVCWRRAICLEFMEKADVLEYYDQTISSPSGSFYIPAVLRVPNLLQVVKRRRVQKHLSRKNIFFRDGFTCQYCSSRDNLTIDHVLPISRGGQWTWENLVTACAKCNSRKGKKTVEEAGMKLNRIPKAPKNFDIHSIPLTASALKVLKMRKGFPDEWRQYLAQPSAEP
ncbi:uncharacterized protein LOC116266796 isoform X2 [Nymphaea colorata]|uniref:uncharacterized protein LOC116266796 isoform X2 n=1 Tax=Nymphaea colorata TaxID=210225 RepID=UPI00129E7AE0|nr:uncharacterized protein LOC116266796 isoform X2 [Nymphaea colorata]